MRVTSEDTKFLERVTTCTLTLMYLVDNLNMALIDCRDDEDFSDVIEAYDNLCEKMGILHDSVASELEFIDETTD